MASETQGISQHALAIAFIGDLMIDLRLMLAGKEPFEPITPERLDKWSEYRRELERCSYRSDRVKGAMTMNPEQKRITKDDIHELAYREPIIYNTLKAYQKEWLTWEEALMTCIYLLAQKAKEMEEAAIEARKNKAA